MQEEDRVRKISDIIALSLLGLLVLGLLIYFVPVSVKVHKTVPALEIKMDEPDHCEEREITLDGRYIFYLIQPDRFSGTIKVSGYDLPTEEASIELPAHSGTNTFQHHEGDRLICDYVFYSKRFLKNIALGVPINYGTATGHFNFSLSDRDGTFIVEGANTFEEAVNLYRYSAYNEPLPQ